MAAPTPPEALPGPPASTLPATQTRAAHPHIHVRRTKTAGWQVVFHGTRRSETLRRRDTFIDAIMAGAAYARIHECRLEVDQ